MAEVQLPIKPFKPAWPKLLLAFLVLVVFFGIGIFVMVYRLPNSRIGSFLGARFPFPLVLIGQGVAVTTQSLANNRTALRHFYESQDFAGLGMRVDFSTPEGKQRLKIRERDLINKMLEDRAVELLAHERGIVVTSAEVADETTVKMKELGTTDKVEETLARLYGWTVMDFQDQIVRPAMYEKALFTVYHNEVDQTIAKDRITAADQELKTKKSFAEVAQQYSQGETSNQGGDLGWFRLEDLAPDLRSPVDNAQVNIRTGVIESQLGYHIILVEGTKLEDNIRMYHIRQIFTRKLSFSDWLKDKMKALPISVLSPEYEWRVDEARIEFRSETMRVFEKKLRESSEHDPTVLF